MKCAMIWGTAAMPVDLEAYAKDVDAQIRQIGGNLEPARSRKTDDRGTRGKSALGAMSRRTRSPNP
jgi:hypothetical protein